MPIQRGYQPEEELDLTNPPQGDSGIPKEEVDWQRVFTETEKRSPKFFRMLVKAADIHNRKNLNYAGQGTDPFANFREAEKYACPSCGEKIPAWLGVAIRISDKTSRINNLLGGIPDMVGESLLDTYTDLGVYSKIFCILYEEWEEKKKKKL